MKPDEIRIEILDDGTIKTTAGHISPSNHASAEEFLKALQDDAGGDVTITRLPRREWVAATDIVAANLLPGFYDPEFIALERTLRAEKGRYVELCDLVRPAPVQQQSTPDPTWFATPYRGAIEIRYGAQSDTGDRLVLPREAILVARASDAVPVTLWREDIFLGKGAANSRITALESLTPESVAWIGKELREPYCQKQIRRALRGSGIATISVSDLLHVRVRQMPLEERMRANEAAVQELRTAKMKMGRNLQHGSSTRPVSRILSGATFEERRQQFEENLLQEAGALPLAFVEASTSNPSSDLFAIRFLADLARTRQRLEASFPEIPDAGEERHWRHWYWEGAENAFRIFHSLVEEAGPFLPTYLLRRLAPALMTAQSPAGLVPSLAERWVRNSEGQILLPSPDQITAFLQAAMEPAADPVGEMQHSLGRYLDVAGLDGIQRFELLQDAHTFLRRLFRPILALRITRAGHTAGVYFVAWSDRGDDPAAEKACLVEFGEYLLRILEPPKDFIEEVTRRESIRRLSWFSHQINGPLGRAEVALRDIQEFLKQNPPVAAALVPDRAMAESMARMTAQPIESYQVHTRLGAALQAIHELKQVNYQLRQWRRAQADLQLLPCKLLPLLQVEVERARQSLPNLRIGEMPQTDEEISADVQLLREALQEVFNNAIRELKTRKTEEPSIQVSLSRTSRGVQIEIRDNGLPALMTLIDQPFDEDSSTYSQNGQGSGLGLTIVREIIERHAGTCSLESNRDADGERAPGVTFICVMPLPKETTPNDERRT